MWDFAGDFIPAKILASMTTPSMITRGSQPLGWATFSHWWVCSWFLVDILAETSLFFFLMKDSILYCSTKLKFSMMEGLHGIVVSLTFSSFPCSIDFLFLMDYLCCFTDVFADFCVWMPDQNYCIGVSFSLCSIPFHAWWIFYFLWKIWSYSVLLMY